MIITYEMSYKIANTNWIQLAFSGVLVAGICRFHSSLHQVILVQLVLMVLLLIIVALPFLDNALSGSNNLIRMSTSRPIRVIRHIPEDQVIAEFLKSDYRKSCISGVIRKPCVTSSSIPTWMTPTKCATARALVHSSHLSLWKELPAETEMV